MLFLVNHIETKCDPLKVAQLCRDTSDAIPPP